MSQTTEPQTIPAARRWVIDRASLYILGASLALATMGSMTHAVGPRCDWLVVSLVRAVMMFATAATLTRSAGSALVVWRPRSLWVRSLAGSCSLVCNFYALTRLPVADAITLFSIQPLWIVLISAVFLRRNPRPAEWIGVSLGLAGVVLIERPHLSGDRLAALVAMLSSVSSAVAMLGLHRLRHLDSRAVVAHFAGVASLVSLGWLAVRGQPLSPALGEPSTWVYLLGIGATGTLGQILLTRAYAVGSPAKVAIAGLSQVVFAMAYDVALWGRSIDPTTFAGFALVLAPTTWLSLRSARMTPPRPSDAEG